MSLPTKPYFIRALYEWCSDNGYTPYISVYVNDHIRVPRQFVQDNQITFNISMNATKDLLIDNEWLSFNARFGGVAQDIVIPIGHIIGIFARETGEGMGFEVEEWQPEHTQQTENHNESNQTQTDEPKQTHENKPKKGLKLVK